MDGTGRTLAAQRLRSGRRSRLNSLRRRCRCRDRFHNTRRRPDRPIRTLSLGSLAARHNNACDSSACNQTELNVHHRFPLFASSANFRLTHHNFMINRLLPPPRRTARSNLQQRHCEQRFWRRSSATTLHARQTPKQATISPYTQRCVGYTFSTTNCKHSFAFLKKKSATVL